MFHYRVCLDSCMGVSIGTINVSVTPLTTHTAAACEEEFKQN